MKKIYIAGKVTGEPVAECINKFESWEQAISSMGFEVMNPIKIVGNWKTPWEQAMGLCIEKMIKCDALFLLPDWEQSKGATLEHQIMVSMGKPVYSDALLLKQAMGKTFIDAAESIYHQVLQERKNQQNRWGEQNHPILDPALIERSPMRMAENYEIPSERRAKQLCEINFDRKTGTWMHILVEEVCEVTACGSDAAKMRQELIQVAAVSFAMIESLDRNGR